MPDNLDALGRAPARYLPRVRLAPREPHGFRKAFEGCQGALALRAKPASMARELRAARNVEVRQVHGSAGVLFPLVRAGEAQQIFIVLDIRCRLQARGVVKIARLVHPVVHWPVGA